MSHTAPHHRRSFSLFAAALFALSIGGGVSLGGCSAFETNLQDTEVDYLESAKENFDAGEKALSEKHNNQAIKFFEHVKTKYPYSKYASLAELRVADAHFAREKWLEAADAYRIFVRFHPRHEQVAYASFRAALSYSHEIDEDVPLLPRTREKDQSATRDAIRAFDDYLVRFPNDEHVKEAKELRLVARTKLADADLYAAEFYQRRERWKRAIGRYDRIATEFGDTPQAPHALLTAGELAHEKLDDDAVARGFLQRLVQEHPDSSEAAEAKSELAVLGKGPATSTPPATIEPDAPSAAPLPTPAATPVPDQPPVTQPPVPPAVDESGPFEER